MSTVHSILDKEHWTLDELKFLLRNDPSSVQELNHFGLSPLHRVLKSNRASMKVIKCLLRYGANPNSLGCGNADNHPVFLSLFYGRKAKVIGLLLKEGAQVGNIYDREGHSPLCVALRVKHSAHLIKMLLAAGCSPTNCSHYDTVMHCSMSYRETKLRANVCRLLVENDASFLVRDDSQRRSFLCHALSWNAEPEAIQVFLDAGCSLDACQEHYSALGCAVDRRGVLKMGTLQILLNAGARVGYVKKSFEDGDRNILMFKVLETPNYDLDTIKLLYDCDTDEFPDGWPKHGLLHSAVKNFACNPKVLQFLIDQGADPGELISGLTPLHLAMKHFCRPPVFKVLLSNGCPANRAYGVHHSTALKEALKHDCLILTEELLRGGARLGAEGSIPKILQEALENYDSSPYQKRLEYVKTLLKYAYLENPKFDMKVLALGRKHYSSFSMFTLKCLKEIKIMKSAKIFQFIGRYSDYKPKARRDQLLRVPSVNRFSVYFDVMCATYGRKAMDMRIQVQLIYCISSGSNARIIFLNHDISCKIARPLADIDLFSLLVALYSPNKPTCHAEQRKRCLEEEPAKPCKRLRVCH